MRFRWSLYSLFKFLTVIAVVLGLIVWWFQWNQIDSWTRSSRSYRPHDALIDEFDPWIRSKGAIPIPNDFNQSLISDELKQSDIPYVLRTYEGRYRNGKPYYVQVCSIPAASDDEFTEFWIKQWNEYRRKAWETSSTEERQLLESEVKKWISQHMIDPNLAHLSPEEQWRNRAKVVRKSKTNSDRD